MLVPARLARVGTSVGIALVAALALTTSGCVPGADGQGGAELPQLAARQHVEAAATAFEATVEESADGCMRVQVTSPAGEASARWALWPKGSELYAPDAPDPSQVRSYARVGGEDFSAQDHVTGTARLVTLGELPDGQSPGSHFYGAGRYCGAQDSGVIVIDAIQHA